MTQPRTFPYSKIRSTLHGDYVRQTARELTIKALSPTKPKLLAHRFD
ncbi:hypothetical protein SAMN05216420_11670 [Nitrosospira sp. Nl5]|nr:hypothetical protein [Nitrosospira sp. Nl5]SCY75367.1 hypothetical protein SAMN05216420_11670 [Nitrosospira sp. Nl5]